MPFYKLDNVTESAPLIHILTANWTDSSDVVVADTIWCMDFLVQGLDFEPKTYNSIFQCETSVNTLRYSVVKNGSNRLS